MGHGLVTELILLQSALALLHDEEVIGRRERP